MSKQKLPKDKRKAPKWKGSPRLKGPSKTADSIWRQGTGGR